MSEQYQPQNPQYQQQGQPYQQQGQTYQSQGQPYQPQGQQYQQPYSGQPAVYPYPQKSRTAAGVLGILLGGLGIHNFYLGRVGIAIAQLLISLLSLGILAWISWIWGLVEGILYLTSQDPRWSTDARGIPLS